MSIVEEFCSLRDKIIEKRYKNLNNQQIEAVLNSDRNLALIACPGAGKTTTLIRKVDYLVNFGNAYKTKIVPENISNQDISFLKKYLCEDFINDRIEYLLRYNSISPNNIIIITFTRAAALTMKERYKQMNKVGSPFFGTFHGLFYKILNRHYGKINIIDSNTAYRLIKNVLATYLDEISDEKVKETINAISFYKTNNISMEEFNPSMDKNVFIQCYKTYEEYKKEKKLLDFDDLQIKCRDLFGENKHILNGYRRLFKYILVDEFQDCDEMQIDILKFFNDSHIFAVGDEDQCIYSFRGAKPECLVGFEDHFKEGKKLYLGRNYRCPENVVQISNNLIKNNIMRNNKDICAEKIDRPKISILNHRDENIQAENVSLNIIKLKQINKYEYSNNAILYRTNIESRSVIDCFIRKGIPFKLLDKQYNFFEHFICRDILSYLKLSIDKGDRESFLRIINKPFRYISKINIEKVKRSPDNKDCFEALKNVEDIPVFQLKDIDKLKKDIQNLNKMSLSGAVNFVLNDLKYYNYLKQYSKKFKMDIKELEEIVDEFKSSLQEYRTIITFLSHVEEVKETIKNKPIEEKDAVILSTIHGVKGMEFKNVFIINCNEENIPHVNSMDKNIEEERRLFYVGITRTIENLWLSTCSNIRGKNKTVSRFIEECNLASVLNEEFKTGDRILHKTFGIGEVNYIDNKKIEIKFTDEIIRAFDPMILYNNGLIERC
ncbi:ATP-dependent helicase [Clostridium sp. MB40-C1]|uniref:ATP-dependent helicase n=1 Tax=Clostridium sp. MB40-C1 TaxID=3070996 RepID=UPI0027E1D35D|nr:ATP-dependent helicase [Clostridium sp. MB40-C1]WMJ80887.1 ATP-dependent helicase [Clostridium sp. MB40-C1]